ncbi:hypothetical protein QYE76_010397 [Lolium multiflorum]|uniref:DUF4218 domain-containing protein n=1 Tax=Lolium multiflorum TaxID=4521 RepID=A0AAD8TTJ5_LOLMU|nr:hypothetical protein QYE76_010397 [Lolium multiflorum]
MMTMAVCKVTMRMLLLLTAWDVVLVVVSLMALIVVLLKLEPAVFRYNKTMVWVSRGDEHRTRSREQLDVKMDVKPDMELDMKISHGRARAGGMRERRRRSPGGPTRPTAHAGPPVPGRSTVANRRQPEELVSTETGNPQIAVDRLIDHRRTASTASSIGFQTGHVRVCLDQIYSGQLGPMFLHNMMPFDRQNDVMKGYVRNRARPDASMAKGFLTYGCISFCQNYLTTQDDQDHVGLPPGCTSAGLLESFTGRATAQSMSALSIDATTLKGLTRSRYNT